MDFQIKNAVLEAYLGQDPVVRIPQGVHTIGDRAFRDAKGVVEEVIVPEGVACIEGCAFQFCSKLKAVTLPSTVKQIGDRAFAYCDHLVNITLPEGLVQIGEGAFYSCTALKRLSVPAGVSKIGKDAFASCSKLTLKITVSDPNPRKYLETVVGEYDGPCSIHLTLTQPSVAPDCVPCSPGAEVCRLQIHELTLADGVTHCRLEGFGGYEFRRLYLPKSLKTIDPISFYRGGGAREVYLQDLEAFLAIPMESADAQPLCHAGSLYVDGMPVSYCKLPAGTRSLGAYALAGCGSLKSITFPEGFETVGEGALADCICLKSIQMSDSLRVLGRGAFAGCRSLETVEISNGVKVIPDEAFDGCEELRHVTLPIGLEEIGDNAFRDCTALRSIRVPATLKKLSDSAFAGCERVEIISVGQAEEVYEGQTFVRCPQAAATVSIRPGTVEIADGAFEGCAILKEIVIPEGVTRLGHHVFRGCVKLKQLTLPASLKEVWFDTFNDMVGEEWRHNFLYNCDPPKLCTEHPRAGALRALLQAGNEYRKNMGALSTVCALLHVDSNDWDDGGSVQLMEDEGGRYYSLSVYHSYIEKYADHESGMDIYASSSKSYVLRIPASVPAGEEVLYAVEHLEDWKQK